MVKRFVVPFAASGDKTVTPDATDPGGAISYSQGWPVAYQLADTDPAYRPVGRQEMNGVFNDITGAIAELQTLGFPEWVAVTGLVVPYRVNATVRHNDINWQSVIANNSDEPGVGPGATSWRNVSAVVAGRVLNIRSFSTVGTSTYTPTAGTVAVDVFVLGAGGGGGSNAATPAAGFSAAAQGGNAGAVARGRYTSGFSGVTITVGAGGAGGVVNTVGASGSTGGSSSFGALVSAQGGGGGDPGTARNAFPTGGTINASVAVGSSGNIYNGAGAFGSHGILYAANNVTSGQGASSPIGAGGCARTINTGAGSGASALGYGSGGAGACSVTGGTSVVGGNGSGGIVIVVEYS